MSLTTHKFKNMTLDVGGVDFECQVSNFQIINNANDGAKLYSFCPTGEDVEEVDPDWSIQFTIFSDWSAGGVSDYLMSNAGDVVTFTYDHNTDIAAQHVQITGSVRLKAPNIGGDVRATETQDVTLQVLGDIVYTRP